MINFNSHKNKGFTLVETLVAISILVAIIAASMSAIQTTLNTYITTKDEVIAVYLAQEGIEQLQAIRDANRLWERPWLSGIADTNSDPCYFDKSCTVSPVEQSTAIACPAVGNCPVINMSADGFYGYGVGWTPTPFTREIQVRQVDAANPDEVAVTVTVTWSKGTQSRHYTVQENLINWQ